MTFITIIIKYITYFSCIYIKKKTKSRHKMCHDNHDSGWGKDGCRWVQMGIDGCKRVHWGACIWGDTEHIIQITEQNREEQKTQQNRNRGEKTKNKQLQQKQSKPFFGDIKIGHSEQWPPTYYTATNRRTNGTISFTNTAIHYATTSSMFYLLSF